MRGSCAGAPSASRSAAPAGAAARGAAALFTPTTPASAASHAPPSTVPPSAVRRISSVDRRAAHAPLNLLLETLRARLGPRTLVAAARSGPPARRVAARPSARRRGAAGRRVPWEATARRPRRQLCAAPALPSRGPVGPASAWPHKWVAPRGHGDPLPSRRISLSKSCLYSPVPARWPALGRRAYTCIMCVYVWLLTNTHVGGGVVVSLQGGTGEGPIYSGVAKRGAPAVRVGGGRGGVGAWRMVLANPPSPPSSPPL